MSEKPDIEEYWEVPSGSNPGAPPYKLGKNKRGDIIHLDDRCLGYARWGHCRHQVIVIRGQAKHVVVDWRMRELQFASTTNHHVEDPVRGRCEKCGMPRDSWQFVICRGFKIAGSYDVTDIVPKQENYPLVMRK